MIFDVVVCTKNSALTLDKCLTSLKQSDVPYHTIFVVDAFSKDGTREIAEKHNCTYVLSNLKVALARRFGAKLCKTPYFISLDSDIAIPPNFYTWLAPNVEDNFITKGIFINQLPEKDAKIIERDFYWINHNVGSFDCCIINRETFLKITEEWESKQLDGGEDTLIFAYCEKHNIPVHQDTRVISRHYVHNVLRIIKQDRWYGKSSRKGNIPGRFCRTRSEFLPWEMLMFPVMGFIEMLKWKTWRLLFYETAKMLFWFYGYVIG